MNRGDGRNDGGPNTATTVCVPSSMADMQTAHKQASKLQVMCTSYTLYPVHWQDSLCLAWKAGQLPVHLVLSKCATHCGPQEAFFILNLTRGLTGLPHGSGSPVAQYKGAPGGLSRRAWHARHIWHVGLPAKPLHFALCTNRIPVVQLADLQLHLLLLLNQVFANLSMCLPTYR